MSKLVIGVVGTQCVGKSTMINDVVEASSTGSGDKYVTSNIDYRDKIKAAGLKINRNGDLKSQEIIFDTMCENIVHAIDMEESNRIILDRTPIDAYVYTLWHKRFNPDVEVPDSVVDRMWYRLSKYCQMLDAVVYIPLSQCDEVKIVDDQFRDTDETYRAQIDQIFQEALKKLVNNGVIDQYDISGDRARRVKTFFMMERNLLIKNRGKI